MLGSLQSRCISALHITRPKQLTKCQQNFCRIISAEQKLDVFINLPESIKMCNLDSLNRSNACPIKKISMVTSSLLSLEGTNIEKHFFLPLYIPNYTNVDNYINIVKSSYRNTATYSTLSFINFNVYMQSSPENTVPKTLPNILNSCSKILQIMDTTSSVDDDIHFKTINANCIKFMNTEINDRSTEQSTKFALQQNTMKNFGKAIKCNTELENHNTIQNFGNACTENTMIVEFNHNSKFIGNSSKRKKRTKKRKLMLLLAGACLSCKRSKNDDSFEKTDAILNQEQCSTEFLDNSLVIDDVHNESLKSVAENIVDMAVESNMQSTKPIFILESKFQPEVKTVVRELNNDFDQVHLNISSSPENKNETFSNQQSELLNVQTQEVSLFDELPYASSSTPDVTSPDKSKRKKRRRSRGKYVQKKNSYLKGTKKAASADETSKQIIKKRPNYFVAIQVSNQEILSAVKTVQNHILTQEPRLKSALIKPSTLHVTILVCHINNYFELERASRALEASYDILKEKLSANPLEITFKGIGNFQHKVLFADLVEENTLDRLNDIAYHVKTCYEQHGLDLADGKALVPHLTLFKMSKDPTLWKRGVKKIEPLLYDEYKNIRFGSQLVKGLQLLSMLKHKDANGYYYCEKELLFHTSNGSKDVLESNRNYNLDLNSILKKEKEAIRKQISSLTFKQLMQSPTDKYRLPFEQEDDNDKETDHSAEKD